MVLRVTGAFRIPESDVMGYRIRIAVIGSGISGLSTGWYLSRKREGVGSCR